MLKMKYFTFWIKGRAFQLFALMSNTWIAQIILEDAHPKVVLASLMRVTWRLKIINSFDSVLYLATAMNKRWTFQKISKGQT